MDPKTKILTHNNDSKRSIITPIYKTSTFVFDTAEDGEKIFKGQSKNFVYSRINHPNMITTEQKISIFDDSEDSALFSSGMSAISTTMFSFLKPGDTILYTNPVYGGTNAFIEKILSKFNIKGISFPCGCNDISYLTELILANDIKMIFIETPCNPIMILTSIRMFYLIRKELQKDILIVVDNTMAGPIFSKPFQNGADLCVYSATKFLGGHSDIIAGCVSGYQKYIDIVKSYRSMMGPILDPDSCWLIERSLPTLELRMKQQYINTLIIIDKCKKCKHINNIYYTGYDSLECEDKSRYTQKYIYENEYTGGGSSIFSITLNTDKNTIFKILNSLRIFKLAVSLGSVESLIQHPSSMTHSSMSDSDKIKYNISDNLIRCSIGLEDPLDLSNDLLKTIGKFLD